MKLLKSINDIDILGVENNDPIILERKAARAVVFDDENKVALLYASKYNYHKIPGGGLEENEDIKEALDRECVEEIGCHIAVIGEIGLVIEHRGKFQMRQDSFCYLAKVVGEKMAPSFTAKELAEGFEVRWMKLEDAIEIVMNSKPENYEGRFVQVRELAFLEEAKRVVGL